MTSARSSVAILLFTRSAREEARHKQFVSNGAPDRNASVAAQLIEHTQATAALAGVDVVCADSAQQTGATFGERLAGAMQRVFGLGYEQVVVIGNDCPQLDTRLLRRAVAALRHGNAVLGPATDGGVYLLGVSRSTFEVAAWRALPWQTQQLGAALQQHMRGQHTAVEVLPLLTDIDNEQDLAQILRQPLPRRLRRRLRQLRTAGPALRAFTALKTSRLVVAARLYRGPPAN